jgi:hypothetical protein
MLASGHEVHPIPRARLAGTPRFPCHGPFRRVSALSVWRVPDCPWLLARPRRHRSRTGHPRAAFFCSNRHSKLGCGRTFPVHWNDVIPDCSLRTRQLLVLLERVATETSAHAAWRTSRLFLSLRTACRWIARWRDLTSHVRALLGLFANPPGKTDGSADPMTLRHLAAAFPDAACPIAEFQHVQQVAITGLAR